MKFIILLFIIKNVITLQLQIQELLIKLSEKLQDFNQDDDQEIFTQLDKMITFNDINIKYNHQCFSDYNQLSSILEINDAQLQFLVIATGCVIEHNYMEIKSGFTQLPKNNIQFGAYINQSEDGILILVFRTFFHKSMIFHQCKLDGFSNQCIKGNNDHIKRLGSSCTAYYKNIFCNDELDQTINEIIIIIINEYKIFGILLLNFYYNKINKLKNEQQQRIQLIMFGILFLILSNWDFLVIISIYSFFHLNINKSKYQQLEQFIIFFTLVQIYLNYFIQIDSFHIEEQLAEIIIYCYIILFILQIISVLFLKKIQLIIIIYLINYYLDYIKAMVQLNTLVNNNFKYGMIFLNIIIGNIQQLNIMSLIKLKNSILHVLLGDVIPLFTIIYPTILIFILFFKGHQQIKQSNQNIKINIFYPFKCLAQIQLSFLFIPLSIIKIIFHKTKDIEFQNIIIQNFYLFWIYFFYFPSDFPFIILGIGFIHLFFNENKIFYQMYYEIKIIVNEIKVQNIQMNVIVNDLKEFIKI